MYNELGVLDQTLQCPCSLICWLYFKVVLEINK